MSWMCIVFISTTLDTDELFSPVQLTIVPSRLLVTFIIVIVDTKGNSLGEESRENIKLTEFIIIGKIAVLRSKYEILLVSLNEGCLIVETFHSKKM